jgi:hypothetical protein
VLGVTVPVTQLRASALVSDRCCCPDPEVCACPGHEPSPASTMQSCGKTTHLVVAPTLPAFVPPPGPVVVLIARTAAPALPLPPPHAPPDPARPPAPS